MMIFFPKVEHLKSIENKTHKYFGNYHGGKQEKLKTIIMKLL